MKSKIVKYINRAQVALANNKKGVALAYLRLAQAESVGNANEQLLRQCELGKTEEIKKLIDEGADVNYQDEKGRTPLWCAVDKTYDNRVTCCYDVVKLLIDRGADVNITTNGRNIVSNIITVFWPEECILRTLKLLVSAGVDLSQKSSDEKNIIEHAIKIGDINILKYLLTQITDEEILEEGFNASFGRNGDLALTKEIYKVPKEIYKVLKRIPVSAFKNMRIIYFIDDLMHGRDEWDSMLKYIRKEKNTYTGEEFKKILRACSNYRHTPRFFSNAIFDMLYGK